MTRKLSSGRRGSASGMTKSLVVFLHGYGADGNDLLGLADPLAPHLPDTVFVAPNAADRSAMNPMGFQWFPIPWLDGSSEDQAMQGMAASVVDVNAYLDDAMREEGVGHHQTVLVGFSQGTMMALHVAPRRAEPFAGVVGFSGRLLTPEKLRTEVLVRPPILLIHGDQDEMVPPQSLPDAANALTEAGFEVYTHVSKGTGHGIAPDGLGAALSFIRDKLAV